MRECKKSIEENLHKNSEIERSNRINKITLTTAAPQSRRKSAGAGRGLTRHLTSYPSSSALLTICLPNVPVAPTTSMLVGLTGVPGAKLTDEGAACALHVTIPELPLPEHFQNSLPLTIKIKLGISLVRNVELDRKLTSIDVNDLPFAVKAEEVEATATASGAKARRQESEAWD